VAAVTPATPTQLAEGTILRLSSHPLQRCGARAVAELAGRSSPWEITASDLVSVAGLLARDIVRAATAPRDSAGYDWWKVLFALYPNAKPTHAGRSRDPGVLRPGVETMFAPDPPVSKAWPCAFCGQPASVLWAKSTLPMYDTNKMLNTLPPRTAGWPVCRACRIAAWALPYGAWLTAGSATALSCGDDAVEHAFTRQNAARAKRIQQLGFTGLPANASAETVTLEALRVHSAGGHASATLWTFKNDNQDPWLRVTAARGSVPVFLRRMFADPDCRRGWRALASALTERDDAGHVPASGVPRAARTLFDPADRPGEPPSDRLLTELLRAVRQISRLTARRAFEWRALLRLYMEVMHQVDASQVKPARELIVDWITQEANPRGRFNEYVGAATSAYKLQQLLMRASARLLLDGCRPADISAVAPALLADGPAGRDGWRLRGLLFFDVIAELTGRSAQIGHKGTGEQDDDDSDPVDALGSDDDESEGYA
jgi:CRISPR-associated protein Cst1